MGIIPWKVRSIPLIALLKKKKKPKTKGPNQASFISNYSTMCSCCCRFDRHHSGSSVDIIDYSGKQTEVKGYVPLGVL